MKVLHLLIDIRPPNSNGLHAILQLHFAQEDEGYLSLADDEPAAAGIAPP